VKESVKNIGSQSVAAISGQLVALLLIPLLSRLVPPSVFGAYAPYLSLAVIGSVIGLGRLEQIVLVTTAINDLRRVLSVTAFGGLVGGSVIALVATGMHDLGRVDSALAGTMYLATIGHRVWILIAVREGRHGRISIASFIEVAGTIGLQVGFIALGLPGVTSLLAGRCLALVLASAAVFPRGSLPLRWRVWRDLRSLGGRYRQVLVADLPASICNTLSWQTPVLFIAIVWGAAGAGVYAMAYRLLRLPNRLIGDPVGRVFTSSLVRGGAAQPLIRRYTAILVGSAAMIYGPLFLIPESVIQRVLELVLGEEWGQAAESVRVLAPWLAAAFAVTHLGIVFLRTGGLRLLLAFNLVLLVSRVLAMAVGIVTGDLSVFLWTLGMTGVAVYASLYPLAIHSVRREDQQAPPAAPE
jgi:O-antigen/teichoic acid export membrane protein